MFKDQKKLSLFISIAAFLLGAIVAGGLTINEPHKFLILGLGVVLGQWFTYQYKRKESSPLYISVFLIVELGCLGYLNEMVESTQKSGLLALYVLSVLVQSQLNRESVVGVFSRVLCSMIILSFASMLGAFAQSDEIFPATALLGLIPGFWLGAAFVAERASVIQSLGQGLGWKREFTIERKGQIVLRPGGITRVFSSLLILGPALVLILAGLGFLPAGFLLVALPLAWTPRIAIDFQKQNAADELIALRVTRLNTLLLLTLLTAGLLARG